MLRLTTGTLTGTGKDLHAAARLVEAATKVHGAPGLRDVLVEDFNRLLSDPALADPRTQEFLAGAEPRKVIVVRGRDGERTR